jgi:hypothetical protein
LPRLAGIWQKVPQMIELRQFCTDFHIDEERARAALARARDEPTTGLASPWYVRLVVGIGAWITAVVAIVLGGAILHFAGVESAFGGWLIVLGIIYVGLGSQLIRNAGRAIFSTHLGIALCAAGIAMAAAGAGVESEEVVVAFLVSLVLTAVVIILMTNRTLQFLASALTAALFIATLVVENTPFYVDIIATAGPVGALMILRPQRRDLQPTAMVLLLIFPFFSIMIGGRLGGLGMLGTEGGWFAKAISIAMFLFLVAIHWSRTEGADTRSRLRLFAIAAVIVGVLLPPGGSAALAIMMLAFVIASRPLALLGVLLQIYYLWTFYYTLEMTLLAKSVLLMAAGAVLLVLWWLSVRHSPEGVRV